MSAGRAGGRGPDGQVPSAYPSRHAPEAGPSPAAGPPEPLHLFEAVGVEIEYMIVDAETLSVRPLADRVLEAAGGSGEVEVERGDMAWSNELALHVVEVKTNGPVASLDGLAGRFQAEVAAIDAILAEHGARLMPGAMHPWMDPEAELRLWPHEAGPVYRAFDRIFDCRGHGWANLQSVHVNLPFCGDEEFGRLHAAVRMALPILPALAASSPVADGAPTGWLDTRMEHYRHNARRVPSVSGRVVPERAFTRQEYEGEILQRVYADLEPHDPEGILRQEWVNARGAIARFDRSAIEIRVLDTQECPAADVAVVAAVVALVRALVEGRLGDPEEHRAWSEEELGDLLVRVIRDADATIIDDPAYLRALGFPGSPPASAGELWRFLLEATGAADDGDPEATAALTVQATEGCLACRLLHAVGESPSHDDLRRTYGRMCEGLAQGSLLSRAALS